MNLLLVGNSFTYYNDMPEILGALARDNGRQVNVYAFTRGGHRLSQYIEEPKLYEAFQGVFSVRHYDLCVLQEYSTQPAFDYAAFIRGVTEVMEKTGGAADKYLLYETWGYKEGNPQMKEWGTTHDELSEKLRTAYASAAETFHLPVAHVGTAFHKIVLSHPEIELYAGDMKHPSYLGSVLAALTLYKAIFGEKPVNVSSLELEQSVLDIFLNT